MDPLERISCYFTTTYPPQRDPKMIIPSAWQLSFNFFASRPVVVQPSAAQISSDGGLLAFRHLDEQLGLTFTAFWYQAQSWDAPRWVIVKCEANREGTNRRAVVSNRPGALTLPGAAYEAYADRGESENRNKELKVGLQTESDLEVVRTVATPDGLSIEEQAQWFTFWKDVDGVLKHVHDEK